MTKEQFVAVMRDFLELREDESYLNDAFRQFDPDFNFLSFGRYETLVVNLLKNVMNDTNDWLSWWIYENNCGKSKLDVTIKGKKIPSRTVEDLYNLITKK